MERPRNLWRLTAAPCAIALASLACARANAPVDYGNVTPVGAHTRTWLQGAEGAPPTAVVPPATAPVPGLPPGTPWPTQDLTFAPTPDPTRPSILDRQSVLEYVVEAGDYLNQIGERYGVSAAEIAEANGLDLDGTLHVGQVLRIPVSNPNAFGPDLKVLPDSEFVYGPSLVGFNLEGFIDAQGGYLAGYREEVPGRYLDGSQTARLLTGAEIVQTIALRYSLSPRLLLALLEHQSGWVTNPRPGSNTEAFPLGFVQLGREGLFRQLAWAANELNYGYYTWRVAAVVSWSFGDGSVRLISPGLNPGTVGVQHFFARLLTPVEWQQATGPGGFIQTYYRLFGHPFQLAFEPLVPASLVQPVLQLPFEPGKTWAYTGGPHGAWDTGSAWAALDFAPPATQLGCTQSDEWVVASAPGLIVRAADGAVVQDLDGDGYEQTGWTLFYMHLEARDRVLPGTRVAAGDRLGHPSCEGGVSTGTHLHMARKYNGEWISADGPLPMVLDGWISTGWGSEYDGTMTNGERVIEAWNGRAEINEVSRP